MSLNELAAEIHSISVSKGFWPEASQIPPPEGFAPIEVRNPGEVLMLIVTEAAEAMEAVRDGKWDSTVSWHKGPETSGPEMRIEDGQMLFKHVDLDFNVSWRQATPYLLMKWGFIPKPEGVLSELVDILIRTLDAAAAWGYDVDEAMRLKIDYNKTRAILHGRAR
jgi:hypothetical protein